MDACGAYVPQFAVAAVLDPRYKGLPLEYGTGKKEYLKVFINGIVNGHPSTEAFREKQAAAQGQVTVNV